MMLYLVYLPESQRRGGDVGRCFGRGVAVHVDKDRLTSRTPYFLRLKILLNAFSMDGLPFFSLKKSSEDIVNRRCFDSLLPSTNESIDND